MQKTQSETKVSKALALHKSQTVEHWKREFDNIKESLSITVTEEMLSDYFDKGFTLNKTADAIEVLDDAEKARLTQEWEEIQKAEIAYQAAVVQAAMEEPVVEGLQQKGSVVNPQQVSYPQISLLSVDDPEVRAIIRFINTFLEHGGTIRQLETMLVRYKEEQMNERIIRNLPGVIRFCEKEKLDFTAIGNQVNEKMEGRMWVCYNADLKIFQLPEGTDQIGYAYIKGVVHVYLPLKYRTIRAALSNQHLWKAIPLAFRFYEKNEGTINQTMLSVTELEKLITKFDITRIQDEEGKLVTIAPSLVKIGRVFGVRSGEEGKQTLSFIGVNEYNKKALLKLFSGLNINEAELVELADPYCLIK